MSGPPESLGAGREGGTVTHSAVTQSAESADSSGPDDNTGTADSTVPSDTGHAATTPDSTLPYDNTVTAGGTAPHESTGPPESTLPHDSTESVLTRTLHAMAGAEARPHPGQLEAVSALIDDRSRVLVVQATGWGKSLVYWAATTALRQRGFGPTVVISPLLALMRDQIAAAERAGLRAATVNSSNVSDWHEVFDGLRSDSIDVLLVSPERLANPRFADQALPLLARAGLLVVDEAHCISDWGFDFRPDYQRVTQLLLHLEPDTPVLATTATANARVTSDVAEQLGAETLVLRGPLARASLELSVVPGLSALQRMAWVDETLSALPGSGIVYCLTVQEAESYASFLSARGHAVVAYTGQTDPEERHRIEDALRSNQVKAVVATSALGMGYDKPDLGFCLHVGCPSSPVAYYQQVGRAGRGLDHAQGILLPAGAEDERLWHYFAEATLPDPDTAAAVLASLADGAATISELESITGSRRGKLDILLKQLRVDGAIDREGSGWVATGEPWVHDTDKYARVLQTRRNEANLMRQYASGSRCLMQVLIEALDDPAAQPCGRCSVCTGALPQPGKSPSTDTMEAARQFLRQMPHPVEPRKLWPKSVSRRGRIIGAEPGRAVCFANDPGWPDIVAELRGGDAPASPKLVDAVIQLLTTWHPPRPDVIVPLPYAGQEQRSADLAEALGRRFGIPVAETFQWNGDATAADLSATAHVTHVERHLHHDGSPVAGRVLLVSPTARLMWNVTVAAAILREAGADSVVPLVVHRLP